MDFDGVRLPSAVGNASSPPGQVLRVLRHPSCCPAGLVCAGLIVLGGIPTAAYSILESVGLRNELVESRLKCLRLTRKESLKLGGAVVGQD